MAGFFALLLVNIIIAALSTAASLLLAPKQKDQKANQFQGPIASAGTPLPVFWGVAQLSPNTVAFGNIKKRKRKQWHYHYTAQQVLCWGIVNEIIDIIFAEKSCRNWHLDSGVLPLDPPVLDGAILNEDAPVEFSIDGNYSGRSGGSGSPLFGGDEQGGGVGADLLAAPSHPQYGKHGAAKIYWGFDDATRQPPDVALASLYSGLEGIETATTGELPRWPNVCYMRLGHEDGTPFYIAAASGSPPNMGVIMRRTAWWDGATDEEPAVSPLGQTPTEATIRYDANPAEILYDIETNTGYGIGRSASRIDIDSFIAAATTLRTEEITPTKSGFGLSVVVGDESEAGSVIRNILAAIDGVLATNPLTGKLRLKLIRNDYDVETLPEIHKGNAWNVKYAPSAWSQTVNEVSLSYRRFSDTDSKRGFVDEIITDHDLANVQATGKVRWAKVDMPYITDPDIATLVLSRLRRTRSLPLKRYSWTMNREGYGIMQGDVVKATEALFGVADLVLRVTSVNYGSLEDGEITVEGVQDVFSVADVTAYAPQDSGWSDPSSGSTDEDDTGAAAPGDAGTVTWGEGF